VDSRGADFLEHFPVFVVGRAGAGAGGSPRFPLHHRFSSGHAASEQLFAGLRETVWYMQHAKSVRRTLQSGPHKFTLLPTNLFIQPPIHRLHDGDD